MKKFLTVLLVIAVMVTFSFGTTLNAYASGSHVPADANLITVDEARAEVKAEYDAAIKALDDAMEAQLEVYFPGTAATSKDVVSNGTDKMEVSEAAVKAVMKDKIYDAKKKEIDTAYDGICRWIEAAANESTFISFTKDTSADTNGYVEFTIADFDYNKGVDYASGLENAGWTGYNKVDMSSLSFKLDDGSNSKFGTLADEVAVEEFNQVLSKTEAAINAINANDYSDKSYKIGRAHV